MEFSLIKAIPLGFHFLDTEADIWEGVSVKWFPCVALEHRKLRHLVVRTLPAMYLGLLESTLIIWKLNEDIKLYNLGIKSKNVAFLEPLPQTLCSF